MPKLPLTNTYDLLKTDNVLAKDCLQRENILNIECRTK